jgi:hypothetical protein
LVNFVPGVTRLPDGKALRFFQRGALITSIVALN